MTKIIKTDFYDRFKCSATDCPITCCQEWKIEVDKATKENWKSLDLSKLGIESLDEYVSDNTIKQTEDKQCCFLNEQKLCKLVIEYGDQVLSHTCATFPRETHEYKGRTEYTISSCCPEVVELLKQQEEIHFTENLEKWNHERLSAIRNLMIDIMKEKSFSIEKALMIGFYVLLRIDKMNEQASDLGEYRSKQVLQELSDAIDKMEFSTLGTLEETNELFLDLVQTYKTEERYGTYLNDIIPMAESISRQYDMEQMLETIEEFQEEFKKQETLLRNFIIMELFNGCLMPEGKIQDMMIKMQWIALEYAMIKHSLLLQWMVNEKEIIAYPVLRDYIVIVSRMMGYDEGGIREYLKRSFQSLQWEWGYLALVVGSTK